jgi:predicted nucleic acid-binding protein
MSSHSSTVTPVALKQQAMHELVMDTNVLVGALRSRRGASYKFISLIGTGIFRLNVSVALALEYEEVLKRADLIPGLTEGDVDGFLDYLFQSSNLVPSVHAMRPSLSDPDDELILDLATQCGATILTYNRRDFVEAARRSVDVLTPAEFLDSLRQAI